MKKVPGERLGVDVKSQGNAGEFWGNVRACEQCARGNQGNAGNTGKCMGVGTKCQGDSGECQGV